MKSHIHMQGDNKNQEKVKADFFMKEIQKIVDRESAKGNIESKAMYLEAMEKEVRNTNKIGGKAKKYLIEMISERIKDEIYYEQTERFTNGFKFLSEYPELMSGYRKEKFTDKEAYDRFCTLRTLLQNGVSEYSQIKNLLNNQKLNNGDKTILEARKDVMDKEKARREVEGR